MNVKKGVGLNLAMQPHYIDHLAPICCIMGIPLLFIDEQNYEMAKHYYPDLDAQLEEYQNFNPEYLIQRYDVLFLSDLWDRNSFQEKYRLLEEKYQKQMRHVHCPHGFSDKGFYLKDCANEDITLIYGQNMLDQLKHHAVFENLNAYIITGNYRYTYFKQHHTFFNDLVQKEVLSHFDKVQPIILYAPTWLDREESTSFFDAYEYLLGGLPDEYNMIVKLHPLLELNDTALYYRILGKYEEKKNVIFIKDLPLVYPLLEHADIYIGDMSSVGYDFLTFNRPMFFLNKNRRDSKSDRGLYLYRCGIEVFPEDFPRLYQIIAKNLPLDQEHFFEIRSDTYFYTFGQERPFSAIKEEITQTYK